MLSSLDITLYLIQALHVILDLKQEQSEVISEKRRQVERWSAFAVA